MHFAFYQGGVKIASVSPHYVAIVGDARDCYAHLDTLAAGFFFVQGHGEEVL